MISACLYRDSTVPTEHYACVKDMGRINRPLEVGWGGGWGGEEGGMRAWQGFSVESWLAPPPHSL